MRMNVFLFTLGIVLIQTISGASKKKEEFSKDELCAGCEAVMKEISGRLSYGSKEHLEKDVTHLLKIICAAEKFDATKFSKSKVREVCKDLIKKRKTDISQALVQYYSTTKKSVHSYFDITQKVCVEKIRVCQNREEKEGRPSEGGVIFNDETQEFEVIMGDNVRIPSPVLPKDKKETKNRNQEPKKKLKTDDEVLKATSFKPEVSTGAHDEL